MPGKQCCHRCSKQVYPTDKIGPLKDGAFFHQGCFKCYICGTRLALKTYQNNRSNINDQEVYCANHVPVPTHHELPLEKRQAAQSAHFLPTSNGHYQTQQTQQHQASSNGHSASSGSSSGTGSTHHSPNNQAAAHDTTFRCDAGLQDLKIAHAMRATKVAKPYPKIHHEGAKYVVDYDDQTRLELIHRKDEDELYEHFDESRVQEKDEFEKETQEEWEKALAEFARKFERGQANLKHKDDLIRHLTISREKKLETIHSRRRERERYQTQELLDRHAKEMLELFRKSRLEQENNNGAEAVGGGEGGASGEGGRAYPSSPPPPEPPSCSKRQVYTTTEVFESIDSIAMHAAQSEVTSWTKLVRLLTCQATCDVDKARAIYRWITIKNLNLMSFDERLEKDTPMGLLRGIKYGTESYHVLFKRLCSYAGLHCVVIRGFSKSAGYQPGLSFDDLRFRNTWNAVYLDGSWRFVQCNWGARHLVNAKDNSAETKNDGNLRYEYDDHYFMTDPEEFIYEFFPQEPEWQLLPRPLTLKQFERVPFVRSLFFKYGLRFTNPNLESVLYTDRSGAATVAIEMPPEACDSLIFHYNLKLYDEDETTVDGLSLKRFVMQSVKERVVTFRVHAPCTRPLLLDVFANSVSAGHYLTGQPIKFKSVCKFKIVCESLGVIMIPLPECASGEWGAAKATRLFGLLPLTHPDAIINAGRHADIRFRMTKPLSEFVASLHRNRTDDRALAHCCAAAIRGDSVFIQIDFPDDGQYGLDIYTRQSDATVNGKQLLTHCCKYLIHSRTG